MLFRTGADPAPVIFYVRMEPRLRPCALDQTDGLRTPLALSRCSKREPANFGPFATKPGARKTAREGEVLTIMARYFFNLRDGDCGYIDTSGVDLSSHDAAKDYARRVAADLMKNRETKTRHWHIDVMDDQRAKIFSVALITQDETLGHLSPAVRSSLEELSRRSCALRDSIAQARAAQRRAKALIARSRGRPHLVSDQATNVLSGL